MRTDFLPVYPRQSRRVLPPPDRHHRQTDRGCLQSEGDPWASTRGAAAAAVAGGGGDDAVADASVAVVAGTGPSQSPQSVGPALVMQAAAVVAAVAALAPGSGTRIRIVIWTIFL